MTTQPTESEEGQSSTQSEANGTQPTAVTFVPTRESLHKITINGIDHYSTPKGWNPPLPFDLRTEHSATGSKQSQDSASMPSLAPQTTVRETLTNMPVMDDTNTLGGLITTEELDAVLAIFTQTLAGLAEQANDHEEGAAMVDGHPETQWSKCVPLEYINELIESLEV